MNLLDWLRGQPRSTFPQDGHVNYPVRYDAVADYLDREVHPHVEKGALVRGDGYLTGHGAEHVATVIQRCSSLIQPPNPEVSAYEAYLLVMAAHFHDVGNIFGRAEHERRLAEVMKKMGVLLGDDTVEIRSIQKIAQSHGGTINGDKDTIGHLQSREAILGTHVHFQRLAAILRFADELADDSTRAARFALENGIVPDENEVFHEYARCLHSVMIDRASRQVELCFDLDRRGATRTFGKLQEKVLLLNEIFQRTVKMHYERVYCSRFFEGAVRIDRVRVQVAVHEGAQYPTPLHTISYTLEERGYPPTAQAGIQELCPDLTWTAEKLRDELKAGAGQGAT